MEADSIDSELRNFFSKSSLDDWRKVALQETKGKDPFESLSWRGKDGILYLPYYDAAKDNELYSLQRFHSPAAIAPKRSSLINLPLINIGNEPICNAQALQHLMNGADGVLFDMRQSPNADIKVLINKIEWPHCYISFYTSEDNCGLLHSLTEIIDTFLPASVNGALFWESVPKNCDLNFYPQWGKNFHSLGLRIPESSPAAEISEALVRGVSMIDTFSVDAEPEEVLRAIAFSLPATASILECTAKFRALRMLWFQIARSYGHDAYNFRDLHVHARSEVIADGTLGPHENMLKGTFASIGAILGGCDALTVEAEGDAGYASRWARNVSAILREESFLDRVPEPLAGAWAIDSITDEMAKEAWKLFQEKSSDYAAA